MMKLARPIAQWLRVNTGNTLGCRKRLHRFQPLKPFKAASGLKASNPMEGKAV
jgi:hypothetical protein